jgi:sulfoxide reductase catalytic subunit YedY
MNVIVPPAWNLPDSVVTPESIYFDRRRFLKTVGLGLAGATLLPRELFGATAGFPSKLNPAYKLESLTLTKENAILGYNNFYEFSLAKEAVRIEANKGWKTEPWKIEITGLVAKPQTFDVNELVKKIGSIEQRNYRHRCVEAWSMVIPWDGFPLASLIKLAEPKAEAKFVKFTSFFDPAHAPGQKDGRFSWPYTEGLTMAEANHELAFLATGIYGKPLANQNGAPIKLVVPWKYGFKGIKSITKIEFVAEQPATLWNLSAPDEYGFYANVNPNVDHPRWSQASERIIGGGLLEGKKPTLLFNGYEKEVASLYKGLDLKKNF